MDDKQYTETLAELMRHAREVQFLDLDGFIRRIEENAGDLSSDDAPWYTIAIKDLRKTKKLAEGLREFQKIINEVMK